jgi:hypothetical protein
MGTQELMQVSLLSLRSALPLGLSKNRSCTKDYITMATAIKAIPTLKGKEAREFLRHAEEAERNYKGTNNRDDHSFCQMAHAILSKAGML